MQNGECLPVQNPSAVPWMVLLVPTEPLCWGPRPPLCSALSPLLTQCCSPAVLPGGLTQGTLWTCPLPLPLPWLSRRSDGLPFVWDCLLHSLYVPCRVPCNSSHSPHFCPVCPSVTFTPDSPPFVLSFSLIVTCVVVLPPQLDCKVAKDTIGFLRLSFVPLPWASLMWGAVFMEAVASLPEFSTKQSEAKLTPEGGAVPEQQ